MSPGAPRIAVAGAGVVGLAVSLALLERGAVVDLYDPLSRPSASAVAAGMLAPAFESALDPLAGGFPLLARALALWPALAERVEAKGAIARSGGLYVAEGARLDTLLQALRTAGAEAELISHEKARALQPALSDHIAGAVLAPRDARVAAEPMLSAMRTAFVRAGGRVVAQRLQATGEGFAPKHPADGVVVAAGYESAGLAAAAPELAILQPIKGQLLSFPGAAPERGPMVRGEGIYISPQVGGAVAGATMEHGISDLELDPAALQALHQRATSLMPGLGRARREGRCGIRAATPDGLPLVGASARPGVFLATGMRRNGWLLAPLVAEMTAAAVFGDTVPPDAGLFDPRRFG